MSEKERLRESANGDVEAQFQKMAAKLGWFQYKDMDSAINTLSQSAKKKSSRSRIAEKSSQKVNSAKRKDKSVTKAGTQSATKKKQQGKETNGPIVDLKSRFSDAARSKHDTYDSSSSSPDSGGADTLAESTRRGSSVFRTGSNSFVNLSLSPVQLNAVMSNSTLEGSFEALHIRRKSCARNTSEFDETDKNFATCYPEEDEVFYSVLNPEEKHSNETGHDDCVDLTSPVSVKSSESEYIEVDDKAVSTGSLELQLLEKEDLNYEHDRTYFSSWALDQNNTSKESSQEDSNNSISPAENCREKYLEESVQNTDSSSKCASSVSDKSKTSQSSRDKSTDDSDMYEVEDKCVGTEQSLSDNQENSPNSTSVNKTVYFDSEEPVLHVLSRTANYNQELKSPLAKDQTSRKSVGEKSIYYDVSDKTLPSTRSDNVDCSDDSLPDIDLPGSESDKENHGTSNGRHVKGYTTDSSEDDDLDSFFSKMRTPLRERLKQSSISSSLENFLVDDDVVTSEEEDEKRNSAVFHVNVNRKLNTPQKTKNKQKPSSASRRHVIEISDSDEDNDMVFKTTPVLNKPVLNKPVFKTPKPMTGKKAASSVPRTPAEVLRPSNGVNASHRAEGKTFLKSLSPTVPDHSRHSDATRFVKQFSKLKEELVKNLFVLYNTSVFDNQLPSDLPIKWNCRLLKTAGYCRYRRSKFQTGAESRSVEIELSTKVCDSTERVRDTLIHELCHAAVWLVNGTRDGHGPYWKYWAKKSNYIHPELPIVSRCHNYSINTKYIYKCTQCAYQLGRHSKSLDMTKKVCGLCHGKFELLASGRSNQSTGEIATPKTPRTPGKFALFVKENYKIIKQSNSDFKHKDVMGALSKEFAEKNKIKHT